LRSPAARALDQATGRAALADRWIPKVDMDAIGKWELVSTQGTTDRWEIVMSGTSDLSAAELMNDIGKEFASKGNWAKLSIAGSGSAPTKSEWKFNGKDGRPWNGLLTIEPTPGSGHRYNAKVSIARAG
jgi:hypothetical protein